MTKIILPARRIGKTSELKMQKYFFDLIKSGKKKYEFRKLSKGLTSRVYTVVDPEDTDNIYGFVKLKAVSMNTGLYYINWDNGNITPFTMVEGHRYYLDPKEHNFIKENYKDKGIEFIVYEVELIPDYKDLHND